MLSIAYTHKDKGCYSYRSSRFSWKMTLVAKFVCLLCTLQPRKMTLKQLGCFFKMITTQMSPPNLDSHPFILPLIMETKTSQLCFYRETPTLIMQLR